VLYKQWRQDFSKTIFRKENHSIRDKKNVLENELSGGKNLLSIQRESRWAPDDLEKTKFSCLCPDSNPELVNKTSPLHCKTVKNKINK